MQPSLGASLAQPIMSYLLAISLADVGIWIFTVAGMAALGVVAWRLVQRQEQRDQRFLKKLDDDEDARSRSD